MFFALASIAHASDINLIVNHSQVIGPSINRSQILHVCVLVPFNEIYAQADFTQSMARDRVSRACQDKRGRNSIFCQSDKAVCSISDLGRSDTTESSCGVKLYSGENQTGREIRVPSNTSDLGHFDFDNQLTSYYIPLGWEVRFYKDRNYSGDFYTRKSGYGSAIEFNKSISSIRILRSTQCKS